MITDTSYGFDIFCFLTGPSFSSYSNLDLNLSDDDDDDDDDVDFDAFGETPRPKKSNLKKPSYGCAHKHKAVVKTKCKMKLPFIKFYWLDSNGDLRCTVIAHLPAGAFKKGCFKGFIESGTAIHLVFDYTHLAVLKPEKYNKAFKDRSGNPMYHDSHIRTVEHFNKVRSMKGKSATNHLKAEMIIPLEQEVKNDWCNLEGFDGFQVFKVGPDDNPQIICHMELMCKKIGGKDEQPSGGYENFCSSGSNDSD